MFRTIAPRSKERVPMGVCMGRLLPKVCRLRRGRCKVTLLEQHYPECKVCDVTKRCCADALLSDVVRIFHVFCDGF